MENNNETIENKKESWSDDQSPTEMNKNNSLRDLSKERYINHDIEGVISNLENSRRLHKMENEN